MLYTYNLHHNFGRATTIEQFKPQLIFHNSNIDHETNNDAGTERHLLKTIRRRQAEFLEHVMIKSKLENLVMTGKFDGKKGAMQVDREQAISLA